MGLQVQVFESFDSARATWLDIQSRGRLYVFQTIEWLEHWHACVGRARGVRPCLVSVGDENGPLYFFPFAIERHGFAQVLTWLGGELGDYGAPIVVPGSSERAPFAAIWAQVIDHLPPVDAIWLVRIPGTIHGGVNPMAGLPCVPYHNRAHAARLTGTWDAFYEAKAGAKTRSTDRRKHRRLSEMGELSVAMTGTSDAAALERVTSAMVGQKQQRYREMRTRDIFHEEGHRVFFTRPSEALLESGYLHLAALSLDGRVITTHWGMVFRERFYYYMPSFENGPWLRYSPGRILLCRLFEWCFENGVDVFDFTVGDEAYKEDWCEDELALYQYFAARTFRGRVYSLRYRAAAALARNRTLLRIARTWRRLVYG